MESRMQKEEMKTWRNRAGENWEDQWMALITTETETLFEVNCGIDMEK